MGHERTEDQRLDVDVFQVARDMPLIPPSLLGDDVPIVLCNRVERRVLDVVGIDDDATTVFGQDEGGIDGVMDEAVGTGRAATVLAVDEEAGIRLWWFREQVRGAQPKKMLHEI